MEGRRDGERAAGSEMLKFSTTLHSEGLVVQGSYCV